VTDSSHHPFRSIKAKAEYRALYVKRAEAWPVVSETRFIETSFGQTFVRVSGDSLRPPLILLPGSRGTSLTWVPNIAALSSSYRTYALDSIYDVGLSVPYRKIRNSKELTNWLDEVITVLVPDAAPSLMGLSYGGWLASQYAIRFSRRVHKVVLLAPAMTVLPVAFAMIFRALLTLIPYSGFRKKFYYWLLHDAIKSGETGQAYVDEAISDWIVAERCFKPLPVINATILKDNELKEWRVPCLFLVGENEKMYSAQNAVKRLNHVAPQIKTRIVTESGHDLWFTQADLVNKTILGFLDE
jgi:pimeloyl-ACP methyl ester carboxylesterase